MPIEAKLFPHYIYLRKPSLASREGIRNLTFFESCRFECLQCDFSDQQNTSSI